MDDLLTQVKTNGDDGNKDLLIESAQERQPLRSNGPINTPEDVLEALRSKPDLNLLVKNLYWLLNNNGDFNVQRPSPMAAQIIFVLVNDTISNYWQVLAKGKDSDQIKGKNLLARCVSNVAGIGAIVSRLRLLLDQFKDSQAQVKSSGIGKLQPIHDLLDVLMIVLHNEWFFFFAWKCLESCNERFAVRSLQWKELLALVASGKVLAIASEAGIVSKEIDTNLKDSSWLGNGYEYATWLGKNIQCMNKQNSQHDIEGRKALSQLLSKALTLGYNDQIIKAAFSDLVNGSDEHLESYQSLIGTLQAREQKTLLYTLIGVLSKDKLTTDLDSAKQKSTAEKKNLGRVAALVAAVGDLSPILQTSLVDWLIGVSANAIGQTHLAHRAVIAVISKNSESCLNVLHKCMELFGDKLYIKHTPVLHQEVSTQILLMLAGYCFRANKIDITNLSRSSVYLNAISNRLAASSPRARFLGMVVGTAISELVDPQDKRMKFGAEELKGPDASWYKDLLNINDAIGSITDLKVPHLEPSKPTPKTVKHVSSKRNIAKSTAPTKPTSKIISIEEINSGSESEEEDLPVYEKPDSDPSDEDEDPTLVQRNRPTAPVYIRDLIAGLRDTENFDRHSLALTNAAPLIRRKAAFGTEVTENIEELATLLVGLNDKWELPNFQTHRLQGMIAILTASPLRMGPWFSKTFYNGDYSMGQRASVLTTLGMGARELAGLGNEDAALTGSNAKESTFPSKRLPSNLHALYALETAPMTTLSAQLSRTMIRPMAASAADQATGPAALKVRTFSSRMAVEKKRQKPIPNALAKIVAEGFFFPLTGRWRIHLQSHGETSAHTTPFLLSHLLKTLSLILHASGSSTLSLPQMTSEFWDFLLSLRPRANDSSVLEALLFAFLTLLDINQDDQRRLAEEHAKELLETQGWVEGVFERVGGGSEEGDRVRMLAAGVLMRTREVVERWQRLLMGDLVDFM